MDLTERTTARAVLDSIAATPDARLRELLTGLVGHLHDLVRETRPTLPEWEAAIGFLTAVGQTCDAQRQEFILLSDVLGASMLVETMEAQRQAADATASTVLGPFHMVASPERALGDSIDLVGDGPACLVEGSVRDPDGTPLAGARVDVWQSDEKGAYDVQAPETQPPGNGRGLFTTDADGAFRFRTVVPAPYPIPTDGPVGDLLHATARHPYRPAHVHFLVEAAGHVTLTTHVFVAGGPYVDSDAVFAVKQSLVRDFALDHDPDEAARHGLPSPFHRVRFDIVLQPTI